LLFVSAGILAATAVGVWWGSGGLRDLQLARSVPALDPAVRSHLTRDSDREWLAYCRRNGHDDLGGVVVQLHERLRNTDRAEFARRRRPIEAALLRVATGFAEVYGVPSTLSRARHDIALSMEEAFERKQWERKYIALSSDTSLTHDSRIRELDALAERYLVGGDPYRALYSSAVATSLELECGRPVRHRVRLDLDIRKARELGEPYMLCQMLGQRGIMYWNNGDLDSMRACFDEGLALARRHGQITQATRLLKFYASFHADRGRLAVAVDRLGEAMRLAGGPGGEGARPRSQIEHAKFYADLGCWDLVERDLRGMPPLLRGMPVSISVVDREKYAFETELLSARIAFAGGRAEEGARRMERLSRSVPPGVRRTGLAEVFDEWSQGL